MAASVHLVKLCVGIDKISALKERQALPHARTSDGFPRHVTRMWPKREADLLDGGSIYWVMNGLLMARQALVRLEEVRREDGILRCGMVLSPEIVPVEPQRKRPFQGWRYLKPEDAPADLTGPAEEDDEDLPPSLLAALADIGVRRG
ncbi:DUF1489 domain-containing protein [Roseicyclus sp. F158]|uniref:DUF1489 domain-containing protein n=1 Tax=Tropicimonas omnivorans TaxID=3075590 RepID=A0ABU3DF35_9RHOB|nr:DUF1489 domain-containing protein [Roseicyclus sp. F158]MDT0682168.1 DUF1489 domain-containing protein [Roseicyclus sp. F158]